MNSSSSSLIDDSKRLYQQIEDVTNESQFFKVDKSLAGFSAQQEMPVDFPHFSPDTIKRINRAITRKIPKKEIDELVEERYELVTKKFDSGLDAKEEKRLTYVNWQLDRIDDAESGDEMDRVEQMIEVYESFAADIKSLKKSYNIHE